MAGSPTSRVGFLLRFALAPLLLAAACGGESKPPEVAKVQVAPPSAPGKRAAVASASATDYEHQGPSYEEALQIPEDVFATRGAKDLSDAELSGPMRNGTFLHACEAPDSMKVTVRVAVRDGKAQGVTVGTSPVDATVAACIDKAVRELSWPVSPKRNTFTTNY